MPGGNKLRKVTESECGTTELNTISRVRVQPVEADIWGKSLTLNGRRVRGHFP